MTLICYDAYMVIDYDADVSKLVGGWAGWLMMLESLQSSALLND